MTADDDVLDILIRCDYVTEVRACGDGCVIRYPVGSERACYGYGLSRRDGVAYVSVNSTAEDGCRTVELPEHAVRPYLERVVPATSGLLGCSAPVVFYDGSGRRAGGMKDVIGPPESGEEKEREALLDRLLGAVTGRGVTTGLERAARDGGVYESFVSLAR